VGRPDRRKPPGLSVRDLTVAGLVLVLAAGVLIGWRYGAQSDDEVELGSSGGCQFAPDTCSVPADTLSAGQSGLITPTPEQVTPTATPRATPTATPAPSRTSRPTQRAAATKAAPRRAAAPRRKTAAAPAPTVEYTFRSRWDTGYVVLIRFANTSSSPWTGWSLSFRPGDGSRITSSWNTRLSQSGGVVRATDEGWAEAVAPGEQVVFGMEGTRSFQPSGCVLNGRPCSFRFTETGGKGRGRWR
jgi:Cellulose binding domain